MEDITEGNCAKVLDQTDEIIERSSGIEAEAHAIRALARLCLHQEASDDLSLALEHADELTPETRELVEAVIAVEAPQGEELRDVLRERMRP